MPFNPTRLKDAISDSGFLDSTVAAACGVSERTVSNWKAGNSEPDASQLETLSKTLKRRLSYFFDAA